MGLCIDIKYTHSVIYYHKLVWYSQIVVSFQLKHPRLKLYWPLNNMYKYCKNYSQILGNLNQRRPVLDIASQDFPSR